MSVVHRFCSLMAAGAMLAGCGLGTNVPTLALDPPFQDEARFRRCLLEAGFPGKTSGDVTDIDFLAAFSSEQFFINNEIASDPARRKSYLNIYMDCYYDAAIDYDDVVGRTVRGQVILALLANYGAVALNDARDYKVVAARDALRQIEDAAADLKEAFAASRKASSEEPPVSAVPTTARILGVAQVAVTIEEARLSQAVSDAKRLALAIATRSFGDLGGLAQQTLQGLRGAAKIRLYNAAYTLDARRSIRAASRGRSPSAADLAGIWNAWAAVLAGGCEGLKAIAQVASQRCANTIG